MGMPRITTEGPERGRKQTLGERERGEIVQTQNTFLRESRGTNTNLKKKISHFIPGMNLPTQI